MQVISDRVEVQTQVLKQKEQEVMDLKSLNATLNEKI